MQNGTKVHTVFSADAMKKLDVWPGDTVKLMKRASRGFFKVETYQAGKDAALYLVATKKRALS